MSEIFLRHSIAAGLLLIGQPDGGFSAFLLTRR